MSSTQMTPSSPLEISDCGVTDQGTVISAVCLAERVYGGSDCWEEEEATLGHITLVTVLQQRLVPVGVHTLTYVTFEC